MLYHVGLMLEYIAIIVTLQRIYNRKVCLNIDSVGLCLMSLTIVELVRYYGLSNLFTIIIYILIGIYCVRNYNDSVIGSIVRRFTVTNSYSSFAIYSDISLFIFLFK